MAVALAVTVVFWVSLEIVRARRESGTAAVSVAQRVRRVAGRVIGMRGDGGGDIRQRIGTVADGGEVIGYDGTGEVEGTEAR
ncbi:hypothetical protein HTZ77_32140 [Nonomuraea sp. SMC257]|uniref:Uncharacterized protein n=1 Tax=Nonomuraea montanisoli TaxID=2741721 RepID=A0A7Y6M6V0_9ACTN|nr:hypothetical protein [Nonomuraea montanisoli]NUW36035.1 hypothetical protein [Nonomuraea montanisoli]